VEVHSFYHRPPEDYFLVVSELVAYKRIDSVVREFSRSGRRLRIAGDGPEYRRLRAGAAANVEFLGRVSDADLRELYARSRAFLLPGEEDFGMTPVEALASGKPVIALGRGGVLETVPPFAGVFYADPTEAELARAIERFEVLEPEIRPAELQAHARRFAPEEFTRKVGELLRDDLPADGARSYIRSGNVREQ
jgi:glycosyltransferase involved in cell wall biosynthesis